VETTNNFAIINKKVDAMSLQALRQYQATSTQSGIFEASPHRLIQMLMEGALEKIAKAKGHMLRKKSK
jgi:flagellar protein FliS